MARVVSQLGCLQRRTKDTRTFCDVEDLLQNLKKPCAVLAVSAEASLPIVERCRLRHPRFTALFQMEPGEAAVAAVAAVASAIEAAAAADAAAAQEGERQSHAAPAPDEPALGVGETPARPSASPAPDPTKVMRNVFPCLKMPERLAIASICRSWYRVLPPRDAEVSRAVHVRGLASVIDKNWSVQFRHNDSQGWDSISVQLEYRGRSLALRKKFRPRFVGICFGRFQIPDAWRKADRHAVSDQHRQLEAVMKKYGFRKADQGEGKFEFLKVMVGLDVLIDHIDD